MTRSFACFLLLLATTATLAWSAEELPKNENDESFEIEPPLLIPNRDLEKGPEKSATSSPSVADPEKLEKDLERAKKSAAGAERLFKIGVLARVDVEMRALRVLRLQSELENARLALAKEELATQQNRATTGEIQKAELSESEVALSRAIQGAHAAAAKRERAELEEAELNVRRQEKLLALGTGRKSDVNRAQQKLAELKAARNLP